MEKMLFPIVTLIIIAAHVESKSRYAGCFRKTIRRTISNSRSTMELFYLSPSQCIDHCILALSTNLPNFETCQSFVYDHRRHSCKLFSHDGFKPPAIVHPANGYDLYRRILSANNCGDSGAPKQFRPSLTNPNLYVLQQPVAENNSVVLTTPETYTDIQPIPNVESDDDAEKLDSRNTLSTNKIDGDDTYGGNSVNTDVAVFPSNYRIKKTKDSPRSEAIERSNVQIAGNRNTAERTVGDDDLDLIEGASSENLVQREKDLDVVANKQSKQSRIEAGDQCKTSIAYYVVIGNEIIFPISSAETDVRTINGVKHTECFKLCTANKDSDGEQLKCSSVNYFPKEKKCEMHEILAEPHGPGSLVENDQAIYAEKFCLPTQSVICEENEVFILHVQKKIVKNELRIKQSNSITNCLRHCLEHRFCQTAVLDSVHHRCMLYDVKLKNNDDVTDADSGWVLIENGCSVKKNQKLSLNLEKKIKQSAETEWTEWSNCQFKLRGRMVKVRTRQCEGDCPDGGMQVQRC